MNIRIGVRAHDFGKLPVDVLAERIAEKGFSCIQLALMKAIEGIDAVDGRLNPGLAYHIGEAFRKRNIQIAVLGCYINPVHPDREERRKQINRFKEHIRYARDFGCSLVATETGSLNADFSFHPENRGEKAFQTLVESVSQMVEEAEKFGVFVGVEGVEKYTMYDPKSIRRLLDTIHSNHMQVVFDPVNLISVENYQNQKGMIDEAFALFGDRIAAFHAKDFTVHPDGVKVVPIGKGLLEYEYIIKLLESHKPYINFLMEDTDPDTVHESIAHIKNICGKYKSV